jgi:hypothetical protein
MRAGSARFDLIEREVAGAKDSGNFFRNSHDG